MRVDSCGVSSGRKVKGGRKRVYTSVQLHQSDDKQTGWKTDRENPPPPTHTHTTNTHTHIYLETRVYTVPLISSLLDNLIEPFGYVLRSQF